MGTVARPTGRNIFVEGTVMMTWQAGTPKWASSKWNTWKSWENHENQWTNYEDHGKQWASSYIFMIFLITYISLMAKFHQNRTHENHGNIFRWWNLHSKKTVWLKCAVIKKCVVKSCTSLEITSHYISGVSTEVVQEDFFPWQLWEPQEGNPQKVRQEGSSNTLEAWEVGRGWDIKKGIC